MELQRAGKPALCPACSLPRSVHHAGHTPPRAQHALCRRALCRRTLSMHQHIGHKVSRFVPVFTVEHSKTYSLKGLSEIYEK